MTSRQSRFYDRMRDPASLEAARAGATAEGFGALRGRKYCLLVTYRRSGEPVPTPVWFGVDDAEHLYVRTEADAGKVKRVRANPQVLVGPADVRGKPLGPLAAGSARVLAGEEQAAAERALRANYGLGRRIYESLLGARGDASAYLEVTAT
jgi:PPOX class probable F420-dependent enzyme